MDPSQPYAPLAEALVQVATYLCWSMGLVAVVGPAAPAGECIHIDLWDDYLEPA